MIRLALLILVTLAGLAIVMMRMGDGAPQTARETAPAPVSAAQDAGAPSLEPAPPQPAPAVIPAATQTPEQVTRFPGPPLEPSPEYADGAPEPAAPLGDGGPILYVTATRVNMRSGAGTDNPVVAGLDGGTAVEAIGPTAGEWVQIRTPQGQQGFVAGQFLSATAP